MLSALGKSVFQNYLFVGQDTAASLSHAKNLAKAVNSIDSCIHPDVFFIEPKGASRSIGIREIREVIRCANLKPYGAKKKVFIINEAHLMNIAAANAFLKTLEEPPGDTIFILISSSEKALLPTIASRCHVVRFSGKAPEVKIEGSLPDFVRSLKDYPAKEELKTKLDALTCYFRDALVHNAIEGGETEELGRLIEKLITLRSYVDYNVNAKLICDVAFDAVTRELRGHNT